MQFGPFALTPLYEQWRATFGQPRGDEHRLHGSDLGGCDYATYSRLKGDPQLPVDVKTLERFRRGHSVERDVLDAIILFLEDHYDVEHGELIELDGVVGHLDFTIYEAVGAGRRAVAVIDVTSTAGKEPKLNEGHALKTAFYATERGAPHFAEWVFAVGYGGLVTDMREYWFETEQWRENIARRVEIIKAIEAGRYVPEMEPPEGEGWRCKAYCNALCARNELLDARTRAELTEVPV